MSDGGFRKELSGKTHQMWVFDILQDSDVIQLDVQVLIHALQRAPYRDIILELDCDFMVDERLEEAGEAD